MFCKYAYREETLSPVRVLNLVMRLSNSVLELPSLGIAIVIVFSDFWILSLSPI